MSPKPKIVAMIPARKGSERLKAKNLALLNGRPLVSYAIEAAKKSGVFDRIVVNSEDDIFYDIAKEYGAEFYKRPEEFANSTAKSDTVVQDFILQNPCDIVVWVNPISPLQTGEEIKAVIDHFIKEGLDTLITVRNEQVHALLDGNPLNFRHKEVFAQTQDLKPVGLFVYSIMMWRSETFSAHFKENGHAVLCGKVGYYPVGKLSAIIIKHEEDLRMVEYILAGMEARKDFSLSYHGGAA
ncbi:MAG: acylneuraminate cytidylyltransferase family protein [Candidatus Omnitrophica bacterium]|nr:acylneuraminate cytidylyltransferase family protein [Candidatus Omnitrophota bacterium]